MKNLRHPVAIVALAVGFAYRVATVSAEPIRVAMPSKSLTFLNYYLADKFGLFKAEGLEGTFPVGKADVQLAAVVSGEMESSRRAEPFYAAPRRDYQLKALMFTVDKPIFHLMTRPELKHIQDLKGKAITVTATDAIGARAMAKASGLNPDQDLVYVASGNTANALAALQGGAVAAALLSIPFNFKAEELGYRSLGNVADYLHTVLAGLGTSDARIKSNPAQVKRVIRATLRGMDFARDSANQEKIIPFIMEDFQLDRKIADASLREIVKSYPKDGMTTDDAVRADIDIVREQAKIKAPIPINHVLDYSLLKEVLAEMKK
ncbi:MAG TPA: ABC transporter substrate-binding protein [Candidatus Binatia bacterium]